MQSARAVTFPNFAELANDSNYSQLSCCVNIILRFISL